MMKRDAIDTVLDAGSRFNWITPLLSLLGGGSGITVQRDAQVAADVAMRDRRISQRNRQLVGDNYLFDVPQDRYDDAIHALQQAGVR